ncbi:alpha/beta fold hydrolase [Microbacterium telephonicum]|uniref:Pimeloyl-ACP methyl ester carboxylesterase n=1 Tax=Microbacterium telephonicum TaxID=1714841 RepID=A0A498CAU3_9MICO|nr:alpha/beta hydrolase [Microbacterium telephonicum]RLK52802.1 pimeloyl-ACP methyl ester carboxylesterase [Microbacterium telephonicum]
MTLFDGIRSHRVDTERLSVTVLERDGDDPKTPGDQTVVLLHAALSSSLVWQELMQDLPADLRVIAVDLRGFGGSEHTPVDATRGVRDFSDDLAATLAQLEVPTPHLVGWGLGAAVAMQYALDHPVLSLTLESPISPYGFGGTRRDGTRLTDDDAGVGGGSGDPELVQRLIDGDTTDASPSSPRSVLRALYVAESEAGPGEDVWVEAMLTTSTATGGYPGDSTASESWPGFAAGTVGVLNALAPRYFDVSGIVDLEPKPPILWVRGDADAVVSDASFQDVNRLGELGVIPGWPGADVAPAQPMVSQTRDVLDAYRAAGGEVTELVLEGVGHTPHVERPARFRRALLSAIGYIGAPASPAPPTEAIIISSSD